MHASRRASTRTGPTPGDDGNVAVGRVAFTPAEIAKAAGLSRKAIYRAIENGELRAAKVCGGSRLLVPYEAVSEWLDSHLVIPTAPAEPVVDRGSDDVGRRGVLREALGIHERGQTRQPGAKPPAPAA